MRTAQYGVARRKYSRGLTKYNVHGNSTQHLSVKLGIASLSEMHILFNVYADIYHSSAIVIIINVAHSANAIAACIYGVGLSQSGYVLECNIINVVALKDVHTFQEVDAINQQGNCTNGR